MDAGNAASPSQAPAARAVPKSDGVVAQLTTLLRALLKEVPYAGTIRFHCGHDHQHPMPKHVGYVPQKLHIVS